MESSLTPEILLRTLFGFVRTGVLKSAVDLEVFTHIAHGHCTVPTIAHAAGADERGTRILLDALTSQGFLTKDGGGGYALPPLIEALLVKDSPAYAGDFTRITANRRIWDAVGQLTSIVRSGTPSEAMVEVPGHEFWVEFSEASARASEAPAAMLAELLPLEASRPTEVLDVACGSGVYGFAALDRFPSARLTSLDWANVLEHARLIAERRGVADRITWLPGSAFEVPLPAGRYDAIIASHFYHHFNAERNVELSRRFFTALKPGGCVAVHEWVADDGRSQHEAALLFAVLMLASTTQGDVYTFPEFSQMLEAAGFAGVTLHEIPMLGSSVIMARRAE